MKQQEQEIKEVLEKEVDELAFEGIPDEQSSPLNQPVKEKESTVVKEEPEPGGHQVNAEGQEPAQYEEEPPPSDAPEQAIDEHYAFDQQGDDQEGFEIPDSYAGMMADTFLGSANNFIEVGGGYFVRIRKHQDFYDFEEVVQIIDEQNEKNVKRIQLDEEDKALLRPLLIQVIQKRAKKLTPEQQLLGALISIIVKKANEVMQVRAENEVLLERILLIIREEHDFRETPTDTEEENQAEAQGADVDVTEGILEVAEEVDG